MYRAEERDAKVKHTEDASHDGMGLGLSFQLVDEPVNKRTHRWIEAGLRADFLLVSSVVPLSGVQSESAVLSVLSDSATQGLNSLPGFSVRGILQARLLEQVAIPFSRGSS